MTPISRAKYEKKLLLPRKQRSYGDTFNVIFNDVSEVEVVFSTHITKYVNAKMIARTCNNVIGAGVFSCRMFAHRARIVVVRTRVLWPE